MMIVKVMAFFLKMFLSLIVLFANGAEERESGNPPSLPGQRKRGRRGNKSFCDKLGDIPYRVVAFSFGKNLLSINATNLFLLNTIVVL